MQFVFGLWLLGNLLMSLQTVQISLILFGNFFQKSQAHLAQAHLERSEPFSDYHASLFLREQYPLHLINLQFFIALALVCVGKEPN